MADFPTTSSADGIWTLKKVRRAVLGDNWPSVVTGIQATGGTVTDTTIGGVDYRIHAFTSSGKFDVSTSLSSPTVDVLIIGGGGGGGGSPHGGGGGGGGVVFKSNYSITSGSYDVTVGNGGLGHEGLNSSPWPLPGTNIGDNGENSAFGNLIALGGGGGGGYSGGGTDDTDGADGGSGGGGSDDSQGGAGLQPTSSSGGFGNDGARALSNTYGGGGGGSETGAQGTELEDGGNGKDYTLIFTTSYGDQGYFGGGGGGSGYNTTDRGTGGIGGGGQGGSQAGNPDDGLPNTGGGGGGQERYFDSFGGNGGSGIVLIRYPI